ncbi:MAG: site-2 protease family protein [Candidatus Diapherotrites archaeon]|nr:site-2 protease family protein [Candidatus Diapherotrites archaeon]
MDVMNGLGTLFSLLLALIIFVLGSTYLIKRFSGVETHYVYALWRIERFRRFIARLAWLGKPVDVLAKIGAVIGFGVLAGDYLFMRKGKKAFRVLAAFLTACVLFILYSITMRVLIVTAPATRSFDTFFSIIFAVFGISGFGIFLLVINATHIVQNMLAGETACPGIAPLLPGVAIPKLPFFIPWYGWIALIIAMIAHEGAHGIQVLKEKLELKSAGLLLVGILPFGAFVEPDESKLKAAKPERRILVYAAGPAANLLFIVIFYLMLVSFEAAFYNPVYENYKEAYFATVEGVVIESVQEKIPFCNNPKAPAYGILKPGMRIIAVDGRLIHNRFEFLELLSENRFKERTFTVKDGNVIRKITILPDQELGSFGIIVKDIPKNNASVDENLVNNLALVSIIRSFIGVCLLLSFLLMFANFLPVIPFDGGHIAADLYAYYFFGGINKRTKKRVEDFMLKVFLVIAFLSILPFFI